MVSTFRPYCSFNFESTFWGSLQWGQTTRIKRCAATNAKGCAQCRNIGYWGRAAIYEVLPMDEDFRRLVSKDADLDALRRLQKQKNYGTLFQSGLKKVEKGLSTLEEVLSVAYE
mgnify:CR=1 FL=1